MFKQYTQLGTLPAKTVDMANADIVGYHSSRKAFDSTFCESMFQSQARVHLEILKSQNPNQTISDPDWKYGFVVKGETNFNPELDAERLLAERHKLRKEGHYLEADLIRQQLESWGYEIGDEINGTNWIVR